MFGLLAALFFPLSDFQEGSIFCMRCVTHATCGKSFDFGRLDAVALSWRRPHFLPLFMIFVIPDRGYPDKYPGHGARQQFHAYMSHVENIADLAIP